jgi:hypothetical protein
VGLTPAWIGKVQDRAGSGRTRYETLPPTQESIWSGSATNSSCGSVRESDGKGDPERATLPPEVPSSSGSTDNSSRHSRPSGLPHIQGSNSELRFQLEHPSDHIPLRPPFFFAAHLKDIRCFCPSQRPVSTISRCIPCGASCSCSAASVLHSHTPSRTASSGPHSLTTSTSKLILTVSKMMGRTLLAV